MSMPTRIVMAANGESNPFDRRTCPTSRFSTIDSMLAHGTGLLGSKQLFYGRFLDVQGALIQEIGALKAMFRRSIRLSTFANLAPAIANHHTHNVRRIML
jgi:hypothetical protein